MPPEIVANEIITKPHARIISPSKTVTSPHKILAKDMEDLIHLQGPLTEDAVMRTLQARFNERKYFVSTIGNVNRKTIIHDSIVRPICMFILFHFAPMKNHIHSLDFELFSECSKIT